MPVDIHDPAYALKLLAVSETLYPEGRDSAIKAALDSYFGGGYQYSWYRRNRMQPPFILAIQGGIVYVWSSGVHTVEQGLGVLLSSSAKMSPVGNGRAGSLYAQSGLHIYNEIVSKYGGSFQRAVLVGHSYGGALLCVTAALLQGELGVKGVQLCTFGSPRPGDGGFCAELAGVDVARWMCASDPVPRFPPSWEEAPAMTLALGFEIARAWSLYGQPHGGHILYQTGEVSNGSLPPLTFPIQDAKLLGWATGAGGFLAAEHTLAFYRNGLTKASGASETAGDGESKGSPPQKSKPLSPVVFKALADGVKAATVVQVATEVSDMAYVPKQYRFSPLKLEDGWAVQWVGAIVANGMSKGQCNAFCREGNQWLRKLQVMEIVRSTAIVLALQEYLTKASTTGLGFEPVMFTDG